MNKRWPWNRIVSCESPSPVARPHHLSSRTPQAPAAARNSRRQLNLEHHLVSGYLLPHCHVPGHLRRAGVIKQKAQLHDLRGKRHPAVSQPQHARIGLRPPPKWRRQRPTTQEPCPASQRTATRVQTSVQFPRFPRYCLAREFSPFRLVVKCLSSLAHPSRQTVRSCNRFIVALRADQTFADLWKLLLLSTFILFAIFSLSDCLGAGKWRRHIVCDSDAVH